MTSLKAINSITVLPLDPGSWRVTLIIDEEDNDTKTISTKTHDSRAVDGHDGAEYALAEECLRNNNYDIDEFDFSNLDAGKEQEDE